MVRSHQPPQVPAQRRSHLIHSSSCGEDGSLLWCCQHEQVGYQLLVPGCPFPLPCCLQLAAWLAWTPHPDLRGQGIMKVISADSTFSLAMRRWLPIRPCQGAPQPPAPAAGLGQQLPAALQVLAGLCQWVGGEGAALSGSRREAGSLLRFGRLWIKGVSSWSLRSRSSLPVFQDYLGSAKVPRKEARQPPRRLCRSPSFPRFRSQLVALAGGGKC